MVNIDLVCQLASEGHSGRAIAREVGVSEATVRRLIRAAVNVPAEGSRVDRASSGLHIEADERARLRVIGVDTTKIRTEIPARRRPV